MKTLAVIGIIGVGIYLAWDTSLLRFFRYVLTPDQQLSGPPETLGLGAINQQHYRRIA